MQTKNLSRSALTVAVSLILAGSLSACSGGGGGGNVRPDPVAPTPTDPCQTDPSAPGCQTTPPPPSYAYPEDNALVPTHVDEAHAEGFTGKGVKVAILDSGIDPSLKTFAALDYTFKSFAPDGSATANDNYGHGSVIAALAVGGKTDTFNGGVAPDATALIGQICYGAGNACHPDKEPIDYMLSQGATIFNLSMGTPSTNGGTGLDTTFAPGNYYSYAYQPAVDAGALLVWAAGNEGADTTDVEAVAPHYLPDLEKGWLAVGNVDVDPDNGDVTGLYNDGTTKSAKCNIAADWCLVAPGYDYAPAPANSVFSSGYSTGSSNSTAIVTGIAALVSQAYPWMNGHNLQQTLLTTATHLQDVTANGKTSVAATYTPGVAATPNATYGWGLVNAERAVHGPGQFVGNFDANIGDYKSTFSNAISGSGSLTLDGATGTLALTAANTYTGGTTINGAALQLDGSLASSVTINGGALYGAGKVGGDVNNVSGALVSNASSGTKGLTITGNYSAGAGSQTAIMLGHPLAVGGTATLDGKLSIGASDSYTAASTETLITAGTISGTFQTVDDSPMAFYTAAVNYAANNVSATLTRKAATESTSMSTPVLVSASEGLENALTQADAWSKSDYAGHKAFLDTAAKLLSAPTQLMADASVSSLSGEIHGTVGTIEAATSAQVDHAVALRQNGTLAGEAASAWVQGFTGNNGLSQSGYASSRTTGNGSLIGLDIPVTDALVAGVVGGKNRSTSRLAALAGRVNERDTLAGIYGFYRFDGGYLAGRASWTHAKLDVRRDALIGNTVQGLTTTRTDGVGRLTLEAGKTVGSFTPYVALTALRINQAAFAERGASGFGLSAGSHRQSATLGDLGVRWNRGFTWAGGESTLTGYAAYKRVLNGASLDFTASLVGAPGADFTVTGQAMPKNAWEAGATLDTRMNGDWSWFIDFNTQGSPNRYHAFGANAGLRYTF